MTRRGRPGFTRGSRRCGGGSFRRVLRTQALRRGGCRARHPGDRPPAVPAVSRCRAASTTARPSPSRRVRRSPGECHSHRAGTPRIVRAGPSSLNGASRLAGAGRACGAPLTLETPASPAGLTARARPEARPDKRAANLRDVAGRRARSSPAPHWRLKLRPAAATIVVVSTQPATVSTKEIMREIPTGSHAVLKPRFITGTRRSKLYRNGFQLG